MQHNWIEASRIGLRPKGDVYCVDVLLMYTKPEPLETALEKAKAGYVVFVRREDAGAVLAALAQQKESEQ